MKTYLYFDLLDLMKTIKSSSEWLLPAITNPSYNFKCKDLDFELHQIDVQRKEP